MAKGFESLKNHPLYKDVKKEEDKMKKYSNKNNQYINPTYTKMMNEIKNKNNTLKDVFIPLKYALPEGYADETAKLIRANTNNNQIRKIFGSIKSIEMKIKNKPESYEQFLSEIYLLMPSIAYAKNRGLIKEEFYNIFKECIKKDKLQTKEDFYSFAKFIEAVVAYSK